ncbi:DNA mismatch repair endonuclease MutH [Alteromonas flava]|uniref:DNA mismatch repair endonuclease MutH n=1 Tax=Alteromonas flava TaxID=2048003 RepID=UPI000C294401|nr:DNA mismatch repair endonuclease MutH [Alteromonas flava]
MQVPNTPPQNIEDLIKRANQLAGLTLGDLAALANIAVPANFQRQKGWSGQLLELWLGATAGSRPQHDFPELGVELKTLPIDHAGRPAETTYVCYAPLLGQEGVNWETSSVYHKLRTVLWIPIDGERSIPPSDRMVGSPILWQPNAAQSSQLKADWEEIMERISLGAVESITARLGEVLQLRPKAADGSQTTAAIGPNGALIQTRPRGFYLRKAFTQEILQQAFT